MGLYVGGNRKKISLSNTTCGVKFIISSTTPTPSANGIVLKSSDNYVLKDVNGLYLTAKEDE